MSSIAIRDWLDVFRLTEVATWLGLLQAVVHMWILTAHHTEPGCSRLAYKPSQYLVPITKDIGADANEKSTLCLHKH